MEEEGRKGERWRREIRENSGGGGGEKERSMVEDTCWRREEGRENGKDNCWRKE